MSAEPNQLTIVPEPEPGFLATLERLATNPNVPVETIERLLAVQERVMGKRAEDDFNVSMSAAQAEMGRVSADATNSHTSTRYASYGQLDRAVRPIYTKHGFALSFGEGETPKAEHIRIVCWVTHRGGYTRMYHTDMPADGSGAKGGAVMTKTHAAGAAHTYAKRYLLKDIFNVAIGEDENDGNGVTLTLNADQTTVINDKIAEAQTNKAQFLNWLKSEAVEKILAADYKRAVEKLDSIIAKKAGK